jgi:hypothetical protein
LLLTEATVGISAPNTYSWSLSCGDLAQRGGMTRARLYALERDRHGAGNRDDSQGMSVELLQYVANL